jgi:hypothetical protein
MPRLSKEQSRLRWQQIRDLWWKWDPIGVSRLTDWPRDEYDSYLGPTLRLLESSAGLDELVSYLAQIELGHMGLSDSHAREIARAECAQDLQQWFDAKWKGTFP